MEKRICRFNEGAPEVETRDDGSSRISGYASVFYDGSPGTEFEIFDGLKERIMPGAFDRAIREDDVRALFNHNSNMLLGRAEAGTLTLSTDKKGLRYTIDLPDTSVARDVVANLKARNITGSSFSFIVTDREEKTIDENDIIEITGVRLSDVGPVTYPAYEATTAEARSAEIEDVKRIREERQAKIALDLQSKKLALVEKTL